MNVKKGRQDSGKRRRTGCWTCKERKVRCNEARPVCKACERLSLPCQYGIKLLWREEALSRGIALGRSGIWSKQKGLSNQKQHETVDSSVQNSPPPPPKDESVDALASLTEEWMFVNTTYQDFDRYLATDIFHGEAKLGRAPSLELPWSPQDLTAPIGTYLPDGGWWDEEPPVSVPHLSDPTNCGFDEYIGLDMLREDDMAVMPPLLIHDRAPESTWSDVTTPWTLVRNPSPFALADNEMYLLDYFTHGVSPRCTTWPADNPYARIILPLCISALNKPLFNSVIAVASHQLSLLNDRRFGKDIWMYRGKALRGFQEEIVRLQSPQQSPMKWEQMISTLVMLTFFDISHDSASAWLVHLRCARNLRGFLPTQKTLSTSERELFRFFCAYFAQHEALSLTAPIMSDTRDGRSLQWFPAELEIDMTVVDSLLGCSHELISLISDISNLSSELEVRSSMFSVPPSNATTDSQHGPLDSLQIRRNEIERRLYNLEQHLPLTAPDLADPGSLEELGYIAEARRLSALIYLYFRVDYVPPGSPPIDRLTQQVLALIPKISLRSHVLLWTLFIVGVMGIGESDGDADRKFILERLVSLQHTRELENVRIARQVVEAVWKIRDLRGPDAPGCWKDVVDAGGEGLSLC